MMIVEQEISQFFRKPTNENNQFLKKKISSYQTEVPL